MCSYDGIEPLEARKRSRGGYRQQVNMINSQRNAEKETNCANTRAVSKRLKKWKRNPYFHEVGILESAQSKKSRHQSATNKKTYKKKKENFDSDTSYHLSDDESTILDDNTDMQSSVPVEEEKENDTMPKLTEFELQIEGVNSDDDDILCEVVEEDEAGTLPVAVTIADVVRVNEKKQVQYSERSCKKSNIWLVRLLVTNQKLLHRWWQFQKAQKH